MVPSFDIFSWEKIWWLILHLLKKTNSFEVNIKKTFSLWHSRLYELWPKGLCVSRTVSNFPYCSRWPISDQCSLFHYLLKVNNKNTRTKWEICSPERRHWHHWHHWHQVSLLLAFTPYLTASIVSQVISGWVLHSFKKSENQWFSNVFIWYKERINLNVESN